MPLNKTCDVRKSQRVTTPSFEQKGSKPVGFVAKGVTTQPLGVAHPSDQLVASVYVTSYVKGCGAT